MRDKIMSFISDYILDNLWAGLVEQEYVKAAAHVAFVLAFVVRLNPDDEVTLASKRGVRR